MYSRLPPAPITQPHPDSYHDHTSLMQNFQGERVMNYHPSTTLMPEAFYGTHVSCEPSALQRSSEVEYWEYMCVGVVGKALLGKGCFCVSGERNLSLKV